MGYHFEIWLRGFAKDYLRRISNRDEESYHPHVTIVRPFDVINEEEMVKKKVVNFCKGIVPLSFYLKGVGSFDGELYHIPVFENGELLQFNDGLDDCINKDVEFVSEFDSVKKFHATVDGEKRGLDCPQIDQYMLRLTGIRDKKIWFSYDFVTGEVLNREESLCKDRWIRTIDMFKEKYGLVPTPKGFKKIE